MADTDGIIPGSNVDNTNLSEGLRNKIASKTLFALEELQAWHALADVKEDIGAGFTATVEFIHISALPLDPLFDVMSASENPDSVTLEDGIYTIKTYPRGKPLQFNKDVPNQRMAKSLDEAIQVMATDMVNSQENLAGYAAGLGTSVRYAGGVADDASLGAADIMSRHELVVAAAHLENQKARRWADNNYRAVMPYNCIADLFEETGDLGFTRISNYSDPDAALSGEIGRFAGFRIFKASLQVYEALGAGAGTADLSKAVLCGQQYLGYAVTQNRHLTGFRDSGDSMDRFQHCSWKGADNYGVLRNEAGLVWHGRSTLNAAA